MFSLWVVVEVVGLGGFGVRRCGDFEVKRVSTRIVDGSLLISLSTNETGQEQS